MLTTTVYDQANATITGTYYTNKGECITVEYMGSALECGCYMNGVYQADEGSNEVQHVIIQAYKPECLRDNIKRASPVSTEFTLHNIWSSVAQIQQ